VLLVVVVAVVVVVVVMVVVVVVVVAVAVRTRRRLTNAVNSVSHTIQNTEVLGFDSSRSKTFFSPPKKPDRQLFLRK
jgi:hypothetical protein